MRLHSKVAVITGAAAGIGRSVSLQLAREGADVAAFSLEGDHDGLRRDVEATGRRFVARFGDVTDAQTVEAFVREVEGDLGRVDILVNNAGIVITEPALKTTLDHWSRTLAVNLTGPFLFAKAVAPGMIQRRFGRIVNMSSQASVVALDEHLAYCTSKGGINSLTQVLALEWGRYGVTTNAIAPTVVNTALGKLVWGKPAKGDPMRAQIPVGRFAEPEEVAAAVVYLASDDAAMINGHVLRLDGGYTAH